MADMRGMFKPNYNLLWQTKAPFWIWSNMATCAAILNLSLNFVIWITLPCYNMAD